MHKARLFHLTEILKDLPGDTFSIWGWACGTALCAIGHACTSPRFQAEGFRLEATGTTFMHQGEEHDDMSPYFEGKFSWEAVQAFFEIDWNIATWLFSAGRYPEDVEITPAMVAGRILDYINRKEEHAQGTAAQGG